MRYNESYVETGAQPTATGDGTNLAAVAHACGIKNTSSVTSEREVAALIDMLHGAPGPVFANVKIAAESLPLVFPHSFDGATAINRFRDAATDI